MLRRRARAFPLLCAMSPVRPPFSPVSGLRCMAADNLMTLTLPQLLALHASVRAFVAVVRSLVAHATTGATAPERATRLADLCYPEARLRLDIDRSEAMKPREDEPEWASSGRRTRSGVVRPDAAGDAGTRSARSADMRLRFKEFRLPPVEGALVVGRRAPVGPRAMAEALESMLPGEYRLVTVEHATIEGVILRHADLRRVPEEVLVPQLLREAAALMSEHDTLHCALDIEITSTVKLEY